MFDRFVERSGLTGQLWDGPRPRPVAVGAAPERLDLRADGIGAVKGTLTRAPRRGTKTSTRTLAKLAAKITRPGTQKLRLTFPPSARRRGVYALKLITTAPDGKGRRTTTLKLEVRG